MTTAVLIGVIVVLAAVLLVVSMGMEWIGIVNLLTPRSSARYTECGHVRIAQAAAGARCWRCRHHHLNHLAHPSAARHGH